MVDVSIIGCGHLGSAVIEGLARADSHSVTACDVSEAALERVEDRVHRTTTDLAVAAESSVVIVAVTPDAVVDVLEDLDLTPEQTLLSFAAGVPMDVLESRTDATVVRGMPNLAAETGTMACAITAGAGSDIETLLADLGEFVEISEAQMDVATAVNGSGPAFVYYLIKGLQEAGVNRGLDGDDARILAAQTFKGAAETVLQSESDIEELIDSVATEGGTTIEGMEVLWDSDVIETLDAAVGAATMRSEALAKKLQ
ncbi:MAG: pyrroline-5-carboxylate reductase [Halodesulfurarchaeum sp.]|nr:pyrroline-5-carboxylate reductase [Halodesulfurarchaeum sp.]